MTLADINLLADTINLFLNLAVKEKELSIFAFHLENVQLVEKSCSL